MTSVPLSEASHELVLEVFRHTGDGVGIERRALVWHLRQAAEVIPAQLTVLSRAEGATEHAACLHRVDVALLETEYLLGLACDAGLISREAHDVLAVALSKLAWKLYVLRTELAAAARRTTRAARSDRS